MKEKIEVGIEFYGQFSRIAGKKLDRAEVTPVLKDSVKDITSYLDETYAIRQGFVIMLNESSIIGALKKDENRRLSEDDVFKIIPAVSGG